MRDELMSSLQKELGGKIKYTSRARKKAGKLSVCRPYDLMIVWCAVTLCTEVPIQHVSWLSPVADKGKAPGPGLENRHGRHLDPVCSEPKNWMPLCCFQYCKGSGSVQCSAMIAKSLKSTWQSPFRSPATMESQGAWPKWDLLA